jgi:hypothetical protein
VSRDSLQERLDRLFAAAPHAAPAAALRPFVDYHDADQEAARRLADAMAAAASTDSGDTGLERALDLAERAAATEPVAGLTRRAVRLFVTHHPAAAERLRLPGRRATDPSPDPDTPDHQKRRAPDG